MLPNLPSLCSRGKPQEQPKQNTWISVRTEDIYSKIFLLTITILLNNNIYLLYRYKLCVLRIQKVTLKKYCYQY